MSAIDRIEEKLMIPLSALWASKAGFSTERVQYLNDQLLFSSPVNNPDDPAIILGNTRATAFGVKDAIDAGHKHFIVIGGKPVGEEEPRFTDYILPGLSTLDIPLPPNPSMAEKDYGHFLLTAHFGVSTANITVFANDNSRHTSGNMQVLKDHHFDQVDSLEFYTLSGQARRTLMTARKVLGNTPKLTAHNAFPPDVTLKNWFEDATGRAFIAAEAAKILPSVLSKTPLYVRLGYCTPVATP